MMEEMNEMLLNASGEEEIVSKLENEVSEASDLSSDDDELENDFTDSISVYKDKSIQFRNEPPLQSGKCASKNILNLAPGPSKYAT